MKYTVENIYKGRHNFPKTNSPENDYYNYKNSIFTRNYYWI